MSEGLLPYIMRQLLRALSHVVAAINRVSVRVTSLGFIKLYLVSGNNNGAKRYISIDVTTSVAY